MIQRRKVGSILGFVLVGALLTALVIAGVFTAKRYMAQNQKKDAPSTTVVNSPVKETQKSVPSTNSTSTPKTNDLKTALEQQSAAEKKAQEQKAASEAASTGPTSTSSLPKTGPSDSLIAMTGATLLAAAAVAYRRSRALI